MNRKPKRLPEKSIEIYVRTIPYSEEEINEILPQLESKIKEKVMEETSEDELLPGMYIVPVRIIFIDDSGETLVLNPIDIPVSAERTSSKDIAVNNSAILSDESSSNLTVIEPDKEETLESLLNELDELIGLENIKQDVHSLVNFVKVAKIREDRGMKVPDISYHLVFTGNPGTGKTTIARLLGRVYFQMGILSKGQLIEVDRSGLVAGYLGQTAIKTQKIIQEALGGVLFIDEAYSLAGGDNDDSYGQEAIETILKAMEDHRDEMVVIVAGYPELMHKFIKSNPGLSSRFNKYFEFKDYNGEELLAIFNQFCKKNGYKISFDAEEELRHFFNKLYDERDEHFGNARTSRNIFEGTINAQANRIASQKTITDEELTKIELVDVNVVLHDDN